MPHPDYTAQTLTRLDHMRAWIHDHPDVRVAAVAVDAWSARAQLSYPEILQFGAPTEVGPWAPRADGLWSRLLYVHLDGLTLYAAQEATPADVLAATDPDAGALRVGL